MLGRIFTVGGYTLLSRLTGFARDIMLAAILGAGPVADAFFVAFRLPNHFRAIFAEGAFNAAFVPAYAHVHGEKGEEAAKLFSDRVFTLLFLSQVILLIAAWAFMPQAMSLLAPGFTHDAGPARSGDRAHPHHLSLSAPDHAGDALWRHAQRDASLCERGRRLDLPQSCDDDDARGRSLLSDRGPCRGLGRPDLGLPAIFPAGGRPCDAWRPAALCALEAG